MLCIAYFIRMGNSIGRINPDLVLISKRYKFKSEQEKMISHIYKSVPAEFLKNEDDSSSLLTMLVLGFYKVTPKELLDRIMENFSLSNPP